MDIIHGIHSPSINKHKYIPGQLTDPKYRHPSHQDLVLEIFDQHIKENPPKGYPKYREDFLSSPIDKCITCTNEMAHIINKTQEKNIKENVSKEKLKKVSPYLAAAKNFVFAKKLHKENLEHKPLPDTITDAMYRKAQMMGGEPGLMLKDGNFATGVGWKGYPGYGATRCTKLKVYRPKTCVHNENLSQKRPTTVNSFDKKWRFIRRQKVTPIELAICWDMTPINPHDEPQRTVHIDGSNGSQAPAIFTSVHTPKENVEKIQENKDCNCPKNSKSFQTLQRNNRPKTVYDFRRHKSSPDLKSTSTFSCSSSCPSCLRMKELRPNGRLCVACELKDTKPNQIKKTEFKSAFKAGVPNNNKINVSSNNEKKLQIFQVKRPPDPYKTTGYTITSLAPPFSFQTGKRHEYPDHWRLASVYQHSYKPVHARKRSLLATVFL